MNEVETKVHQHDIALARLETLIEQNNHRFDIVERQIESSERNTTALIESSERNTTAQINNTAARFDAIERKIESLDRRMNWFLGLLFTSWLSTIGVILYKLP